MASTWSRVQSLCYHVILLPVTAPFPLLQYGNMGSEPVLPQLPLPSPWYPVHGIKGLEPVLPCYHSYRSLPSDIQYGNKGSQPVLPLLLLPCLWYSLIQYVAISLIRVHPEQSTYRALFWMCIVHIISRLTLASIWHLVPCYQLPVVTNLHWRESALKPSHI